MNDDCAEMRLLVQADVDGELSPREAAAVAAHLEHCSSCVALQAKFLSLNEQMRQQVSRFAAPDRLRDALRTRLAALAQAAERPVTPPASQSDRWWRRLTWLQPGPLMPFGGGFALAACLALVFLWPNTGSLPDAVVSDHIRALQPGHLMDVVSTDQHTVKPWFDGKLAFAPPVDDFKAEGFPLKGGRLDYLDGKPVAALVYQRRQHLIDLYVWPSEARLSQGSATGSRSGYNFVHWNQAGMTFWAVSDVSADELADFVKLMRRS